MVHVPLPIKLKSRSVGATTSLGAHQLTVHYCYDCKYEYVVFGFYDNINQHLYVEINNRTYRWSLEYGMAQLWYVGEPGIPGERPNRKMKRLQSFKDGYYPSITPQNIEQKLRFMLLFL
jgi:hypothetical protein